MNRTAHPPRGFTIIESMIAMGVLLLGGAGLAAMYKTTQVFLVDSNRLAGASAVAQDMVSQIDTWDFADPRLANVSTTNDADLGDSAGRFLTSASPVSDGVADHDEDDLSSGAWNGLPSSAVQSLGMERYWNVSYVDDSNGNGVPDAVRIAVIVRWPQGEAWRRVVFVTVKPNPGDAR